MRLIPWTTRSQAADPPAPSNLADVLSNVLRLLPKLGAAQLPGDWSPIVDVTDDDGHITLTAEVPGIRPDELKIEVNGSRVVLRGEKRPSRSNGEAWWQRESRFGGFVRQISLPAEVDAAQSQAKLEFGILTLSLPIAATSKARAITVG